MKNKRKVFIFIVITLASGWIGTLVDAVLTEQPEGYSLGMGVWLILPFLSAIILSLIGGDTKGMGIKPNFKGNIKWYILALSISPIITAITVGLALILGSVNISNFTINTFISLAIFSMSGSLIKNIFEEFSWRGYLTPKLINLKINDWLIYLISGLVWSLWHAAYYMVFLPDIYFETTSRTGMIASGCVLMLCWTIMYVEIYRLTKSVWPCVLMHTIENAFTTVLITTGGLITFTKIGDIWMNPINGIIANILFVGIGLFLRRIRIRKEEGIENYRYAS